MINRQRKIAQNVGKDTHVRNFQGNMNKPQSSQTFQMIAGEVKFSQPEPLFRQTMITVQLGRGGDATSVAYPGAFIEPTSGNLHGTYEGPIPGQMVMVGFENGNAQSPFVVNRYPYQGVGNTLTESAYINPLTKALFDSTDVMMGHFSGSYLSFNTGVLSGKLPGSVTLATISDFDLTSNANILLESLVTAELNSAITTITGSTHVALNGNTNFAIKYNEMKVAFDTMRTELNNLITIFNAHVHSGVTTGPGSSAISPTPAIPATADMTFSKNTKVLM